MGISRRTVLKYGAGGALLLLVGGAGLSLQRTRDRAPKGQLQALDPKTFSILAAVVDRMIRPAAGAPSARELRVAERIDALLASTHPAVTEEVRQALLLVENGLAGLLLDGRPKAFTRLSAQGQDEALAAWKDSSWKLRRTVYQALHGLCMAVTFSTPAMYPSLGYPGPPPLRGVSP